jgi:hypothetical protein
LLALDWITDDRYSNGARRRTRGTADGIESVRDSDVGPVESLNPEHIFLPGLPFIIRRKAPPFIREIFLPMVSLAQAVKRKIKVPPLAAR